MRARHLLLAALTIATMTGTASACSLKMALELWPPYIYHDADGKLTGADLELAQAILAEAGCKLAIAESLPALRRQILFKQGKLDLMLAASDTEERRRYARFSRPYRQELVGLFTTPDKLAQAPQLQKIDSFDAMASQGATLLAPRAGWYGPGYAKVEGALEASALRSTFGSFQQGIQMFKAGRADLIMGDAAALRFEARVQGVTLHALSYVPFSAPVHLMLNASSTTMAQLASINAAIVRLEHSGALAAIRARYGLH